MAAEYFNNAGVVMGTHFERGGDEEDVFVCLLVVPCGMRAQFFSPKINDLT